MVPLGSPQLWWPQRLCVRHLHNSAVNATGGRLVLRPGTTRAGQPDPLHLAVMSWPALREVDANTPAAEEPDQYFSASYRYVAYEFEMHLFLAKLRGHTFYLDEYVNIGLDVTGQLEQLSERIHRAVGSAKYMVWLRMSLRLSDLLVGFSPPFGFRCRRCFTGTVS